MQAGSLERTAPVPIVGGNGLIVPDEAVVLLRQGKAPLRFRGRLLCRTDSLPMPDIALSISLWLRDNGQFACAATIPGVGVTVQDATQAGSIDAVSTWVEAHCRALASRDPKPARKPRTSVADDIDHLVARFQAKTLERAFLCLAGEALAAWDALDGAHRQHRDGDDGRGRPRDGDGAGGRPRDNARYLPER